MNIEELEKLDIAIIRSIFLSEAKLYSTALDFESEEQLERRRVKIKMIESLLEKKKLAEAGSDTQLQALQMDQ